MASAASSLEELNAKEPDDFDAEDLIFVGLRYTIENGEYKFSDAVIRSPINEEAAFRQKIQNREASYSEYKPRRQFLAELDISIKRDSIVFVAMDQDNTFVWSQDVDAIKTLHSHRRLYGDLRYYKPKTEDKPEDWQKRQTYDLPFCHMIRFKAKRKKGTKEERHKFSYNVRLKNNNEHMEEYEIDPDIKNPSV